MFMSKMKLVDITIMERRKLKKLRSIGEGVVPPILRDHDPYVTHKPELELTIPLLTVPNFDICF
jgi:hypothetical protein